MRNKYNIPPVIIWAVLTVSILPAAFAYPFLDAETTEPVRNTITGGFVYYNFWLISGIITTFITGTLCFVDYSIKKDLSKPVIGGALFSVGLYHLFNLLININSTEIISHEHSYKNWFISRSVYLILLITCTLFLTYIPKKNIRQPSLRNFTLLFLLGVCSLAILMSGGLTLLFEGAIKLHVSHNFIGHPYEFITIAGYLALGFVFLPRFFRRFPSTFSRLLILSIIPASFASLFMAIHKESYDIFFNAAYFLRFIHYLIPLIGIGLNYIESNRKETINIKRLHSEIRERLHIQQKLEKREALLANAEKIAHLGSWEYDDQTKEVQFSDELLAIFGLPGHFKPTITFHEEAVLEPFRERVKREIGSAVRRQHDYQLEFQIRRTDGQIRHILGQGYYSQAESKLISTVLDITDQKEATAKVLQSEALLRESEAISHSGSWEWSAERNSFFWSDEMYRIHGMLPDSPEINLRHYLTFIHPEDVERFVKVLADTQTTLAPFTFEYKIVRPNGDVRHLLLNGRFKTDFSGKVLKVIGNTQDITELKKTSLQLDRSESIYRTIAKNVPDSAVFLFDENMQLLLQEGPAIEKIAPFTPINSGTAFHEVVFNNLNNHTIFFNEALQGKENYLEHELNGKTFKTSYTPINSSQGNIIGIMVVMHDISDLKQAQHALEKKVDELNRSNHDLEQFAYVASHDLQEPLRKIKAFGERLKNTYEDSIPEEGKDYINRMQNASERMQALIDDLLTLSRISRGCRELKPVRLSSIVKEVLYDLEYAIERKRARIEVQAGVVINGIPSQLRQLFQNLISNSLKFSGEDRIVLIKISTSIIDSTDMPAHYAEAKLDRPYCVIEVKDNGIGFEQEYSEQIFKPFERLHNRSQYQGTGIGLAVCKKIIENHSGFIEAQGRENEGALIRIFLPILV